MADSRPSITGGSCSVCVVVGHGVFVGAVLPWVGHHSLCWLDKPSSHFSLVFLESVSATGYPVKCSFYTWTSELVVDTWKNKNWGLPWWFSGCLWAFNAGGVGLIPGQGIKVLHGMLFSCSVTKFCPTLCDPMDCNTPGFPVLHHLPELAQTHVHWVSDAIQPSHPLS